MARFLEKNGLYYFFRELVNDGLIFGGGLDIRFVR